MTPQNEKKLRARVVRAAHEALADHKYVSAIDVLLGMGLLERTHLEAWRKGQVPYLEKVIHANLRKISLSMKMFRQWAAERGLKPSETFYRKYGRGVKVKLRFSKSGKPVIEKAYRTHYVSPELSEAKKQKLEEKLGKPPEMVVFWNLRDARCSECGAEIGRGGFLYMDAGEPLCLPCAGLGELEYLPAGNATLTRRARKKSEKSAVVVKFSRSRKRYERQGLLVEEQAIVSAENECEEDADQRAYVRARAAEQRKKQDAKLVKQMVEQIAELFPGCPPDEVRAIAAHTAVRGSGRVGRTAAGRALEEEALTLAVGAAIRHRHTNYDELIASGQDRPAARAQTRGRVDEILDEWRGGR